MLIGMNAIIGRGIKAVDGDIGEVRDILFDDRQWVIRYLVAETSPWFTSTQVLLAPRCFQHVNWYGSSYPVDLTVQEVKDSPHVSSVMTVSRQEEERLVRYYGWPEYWNVRAQERRPLAGLEAGTRVAVAQQDASPALRSAQEVLGYTVSAQGVAAGTVEDLIFDDLCWQLRYVVVDARTLLPGKRTLVSPEWIDEVNWNETEMRVALSSESVKNAPGYNPSQALTREYEEMLCDYFGTGKYWELRKKQL